MEMNHNTLAFCKGITITKKRRKKTLFIYIVLLQLVDTLHIFLLFHFYSGLHGCLSELAIVK